MNWLYRSVDKIQDVRRRFYRDMGLLTLRVIFGGFMLFAHGWGKLVHYPDLKYRFPDPFGMGSEVSLILAVFAEFVCAIFVMLGCFTRAAVLPLIATMGVAAFAIHGGDGFRKQELAMVYLTVYAALFMTGAGSYSLDRFFFPTTPDADDQPK